MIPVGYVSKERRLLIAGEVVVPTCQTSVHTDLQGCGSSRLLGATGRRGQPNSTVNSLKTARNPPDSTGNDEEPIKLVCHKLKERKLNFLPTNIVYHQTGNLINGLNLGLEPQVSGINV